MTLSRSQFDRIKKLTLMEFRDGVAGAGDDRWQLERNPSRLALQLEVLLTSTVFMAREARDPAAAAALWDNLVRTCDEFGREIHQLWLRESVGKEAYDKVLQIRARAEKLQVMQNP